MAINSMHIDVIFNGCMMPLQRGISFCKKVMMEVPARVEDYVPRSVLDKVFFGYYLFQIVSTIGLDMQGTLPAFIYPSWLRSIHSHHCQTWHDPFLANTWKHPWYFSICMWEYFFHVPFYFVAAFAYYQRINGLDKLRWVRIPTIMYCTQTITATSAIMMMALMEDFSSYNSDHAPSGLFQRLQLAGVYGTFFAFCLFNLLDVLTEKDSSPQRVDSKKRE